MIVDVNILLYAEDDTSAHHQPALEWLTEARNGQVRIGLPWASLLAFVRIRTHPRAYERPLGADEAWDRVSAWLAAPAAWVPMPTERHAKVLGGLVRRHRLVATRSPTRIWPHWPFAAHLQGVTAQRLAPTDPAGAAKFGALLETFVVTEVRRATHGRSLSTSGGARGGGVESELRAVCQRAR